MKCGNSDARICAKPEPKSPPKAHIRIVKFTCEPLSFAINDTIHASKLYSFCNFLTDFRTQSGNFCYPLYTDESKQQRPMF